MGGGSGTFQMRGVGGRMVTASPMSGRRGDRGAFPGGLGGAALQLTSAQPGLLSSGIRPPADEQHRLRPGSALTPSLWAFRSVQSHTWGLGRLLCPKIAWYHLV